MGSGLTVTVGQDHNHAVAAALFIFMHFELGMKDENNALIITLLIVHY